MTKAEAIAALKDSGPQERFCIEGEPARGRPNLMAWKLSPTEELYKRGKYQVPYYKSEFEVDSHFYETPDEALEELTLQGVTVFYKCRQPEDF
jgi:hypothetical protein